MKNQQHDNDRDPLTNRFSSGSGNAPSPFNEGPPSDAFSDNWSWNIEVRELQPGERAICHAMVGADDLATLSIEGKLTLELPPRGEHGGGTYEERTGDIDLEAGLHQVNLSYSNIAIPHREYNAAIMNYSIEVEVINESTGSSSSYVPDEADPDPVDNDDDGEDTPCECSSSSSDSQSSSSNPCPKDDNGEGDNGEDEEPCECEQNGGGSGSGSPPTGRLARGAKAWASSTAGKNVTAQTRPSEMLWRTNFGSFRGMAGMPYGLLEIVARNFSSVLWTPAALAYQHPMTNRVKTPPTGAIGKNTAFQISKGGTNVNYYCYADGAAATPIGGSAKRGGSINVSYKEGTYRSNTLQSADMSINVRDKGGNTVRYNAPNASGYGTASSYTSKKGQTWEQEEFSQYLDVVRNADDNIRQIWNLWDGLINIENVTTTGYRIAFYLPEQVGQKQAGLYPVTGDPFKTFEITGDATTRKLTVAEQTKGRSPYITRYWQGTGGAWCMSQGEGEDAVYTLKEKQTTGIDRWQVITTIRRGENGSPISRVCETFAKTNMGDLRLSKIEGYGTDYARETTYTYNSIGKVAKETAPDGSQQTWSYDAFGREIVHMTPWAGNGNKAVYTYYRDKGQADPDIAYQRAILTKDATQLWRTDYTYTEENHVRRVEKRTVALGAPDARVEVKETWLGNAPENCAQGRLKMKQDVGGIQTVYSYESTDQYEALYKVTAETQIEGESIPGQSTRIVTYVSPQGNNTRCEKYARLTDGTWALTDSSDYEYDNENRWIKRTKANGRVYERSMMCCGPLWEKDEDGVTTTYSYNTARQLVETIRSVVVDGETVITPETIVSYTRDALGKIIDLRRDVGSLVASESKTYDLLGRLVTETDILGRVTTHAYSANGLIETVTTPLGGTLITRKHADGTILRRYGTGQQDIQYEIGTTVDGIHTIVNVPNGDTLVKTSSTTMNGFGDPVRVTMSNTVNEGATRTLIYDDKGRLIREKLADMAPIFHEYDAFGNRTKTTVALTDEPTILNSRVTEYAYSQEERSDGIYRVVIMTAYTKEGTPVIQKYATLLSSLSTTLESKTVITDTRSHDTVEWTEYAGTVIRERKRTLPGIENVSVVRITDGFTTTVTDVAGNSTSQRRTYAAGGVTLAVTDKRGNVTTTTHDLLGRILTSTDAADNTTSYSYGQPLDQPTCITNSLGKTSCCAYDIRGRKEAEWGTAINPAVFAYNDADQIIRLITYREPAQTITTDPRERTHGDTTTWSYDTATGLATRKTYADGTHVDTVYDTLNRVASITNARGTVATYAYAPLTGELTDITFNDATTPAVTCQHNYLGQLTQVIDAAGTRTVIYNQYNEPDSEETLGLTTSVLTTTRDTYGRASGYHLQYGETTAQQTIWAYDIAGRLSTVSLNAVVRPFTYGYNTQNGLLDTLDYPNTLKRWYTREEKRNLPVKIDYLRPGGQNYPAKTDYTYDELGRPTTKKVYFNTPSPDLTHTYTYNDRNELTNDAMNRDGMYAYDYDNIGNRTTSQEGSNASATEYTANQLNQYTTIGEETEPLFVPIYDLDGNQTKAKTSTGVWEIAYNALNQAVRFTQDNKRIECVYDYLNRRIEKAVYEGENLTSKKRFIYNGYQQIAELDATNTTPILRKTYLWDPMESVATRILAMTLFDKTGTYEEDIYYTHDAMKNTIALFGSQIGRRALYEYGPYGSIIKMEGNAAELNPFRFSSENHDEETGMIQYNYRYYNPSDGRWISRDPIEEQGGILLYGFIFNQIGIYVDWIGLTSKKPGCPEGSIVSSTKCKYKGKCKGLYHYFCYCVKPGAWFMPEHMSSATEDYISTQDLGKEFDRFWCCSNQKSPKEAVLKTEREPEMETNDNGISSEAIATGAVIAGTVVAAGVAVVALATAPAAAVACLAVVVFTGFSFFTD